MLIKKVFFYLLGVALLSAIFLLYLRPDMVMSFADLVWACF
ncbi:hypothetical protein [Pelistega suis]|nr:hypothetical protein [Pelistega suis]